MRRWWTPATALSLTTVATFAMVVADDYIGPEAIVVFVVLAMVGLGGLLRFEQDGRSVPASAVVAAGAVVLGAAVFVAPHDSHDLWSYSMYGRILSVHGHSPWVTTPAHFPTDPYLARVGTGWRHTTSIYGPGFELLAAAITKIGGDAETAVRMMFTASFAIAAAAAGFLVHRRTGSAAAAALVVLHPAIAVAGIAGGHNDILLGLAILGAVLLARDDRPVAAGAVLALGTLVKLTGGIAIIALGAWALAHHGRRWAARLSLTAVGLIVLAYLPLGTTGLSAFARNKGSLSRASAWELPRLLTGLDHRHTPLRFGVPGSATQLLVTLGVFASAAITIAIAWRLRRRDDPAVSVVAALGGYLIFAPYVLSWYPAWVMPTIGLVPRAAVAKVLAFQGAVLVVVYELKTQSLPALASDVVWWLAVLASVGLCVAFLLTLRAPGRDRTEAVAA